MLGVKKDQKVWFEASLQRDNRELTVATVGRRWITFVEDPSMHADRDTDVVYDRADRTSRRGKLWVSEGLFSSIKKLEAQWMDFCSTLGTLKYRPPRGMTLERIVEARKVLGMEQDLKKTEREIFDEAK
jgi:hypothetical protein